MAGQHERWSRFVPEVPRDWMNGAPLRYRPNDDGTFTLYSVGMDRKDDGGDPTPRQHAPIHQPRA
jgi:hypothetical protein